MPIRLYDYIKYTSKDFLLSKRVTRVAAALSTREGDIIKTKYFIKYAWLVLVLLHAVYFGELLGELLTRRMQNIMSYLHRRKSIYR